MSSHSSAALPLALYRQMKLVRTVEEKLAVLCTAGRLPGPVHLYTGEEAVAVGVCAHLNESDWIGSTHRGHGHFLAKGGDVKGLMAEIYGRATGSCGGFGGSMHVADFTKGIMGANGIVGGGIALMTGAALAAQMDGRQGVAVSFFGDGAANQGVLMEALNVSSLWRLPLLLLCENNGFSEFSPSSTITAGEIFDRGAPFKVPAERVDGNDVLSVWDAAGRAVARARAGGGPTLIEAVTYRVRGHVEYESSFLSEEYRTEDEVKDWALKDPIARLRAHLVEHDLVSEDEIRRIDEACMRLVDDAVDYAEQSPWPKLVESSELMFAGGEI
jgi:pyruvate dehydrogenase E1 component alpha subunit